VYHHKPIKNFGISGNIYDEAHLPRLKNEYVWLVVSQMRTKGYVPRFDIDPDFTVQYNENKEIFEFELTVYGIYVGKRKSEWIAGIDEHKAIFIQKNKSEEYSTESA
jgi:hypothetical protein